MNVRYKKSPYLEGCPQLPDDLAEAAMQPGDPTPVQQRAISRCLHYLLAQVRALRAEHEATHGPIAWDE